MSISTDTSTVAGDNLFTHNPLLRQCSLSSEQICSYSSHFSEKRWVSSSPGVCISCNFMNSSSLGMIPASLMSGFCNHLTPALASHLPHICPLYTVPHFRLQNNKDCPKRSSYHHHHLLLTIFFLPREYFSEH